MTDRCSGRVSRAQRTMLQFAIAGMVVIVASLAGEAPALAQTSGAQPPPSSSNSKSQTSPPTAGKKEPAGGPKVITKRDLFFPDLAHGDQPLTSGEKFKLAIANSV